MRGTLEERLWAKVNKTETCWLWTGSLNYPGGYGEIREGAHKGRKLYAHRVAYELFKGEIPAGMHIDHTCHVKNCVKPDHLRAVTCKQNMENRTGANRDNVSSGVLGVSWSSWTRNWRARVRHNGKRYEVGNFATIEEAEAAVRAKRLELFTHNDLDRIPQAAASNPPD